MQDTDGNHWDAIVIGSGMGGMTSAAALAKMGHKVLLLEQYKTLGGLTHSFRARVSPGTLGSTISAASLPATGNGE